ncbi:MAG: hypothetical protein J2P55_16000, partial [Rhizobiales bacterium]|nr:hypothetical protein [Hyphomicrobiales bacterium]
TAVRIMTCVMVRRVQAVRRYRMAGESVAGHPMRVQSMCRETVKTRYMTKAMRAGMRSKSMDAVKRRMESANPSPGMDAAKRWVKSTTCAAK